MKVQLADREYSIEFAYWKKDSYDRSGFLLQGPATHYGRVIDDSALPICGVTQEDALRARGYQRLSNTLRSRPN
jgi:hypothetical protein